MINTSNISRTVFLLVATVLSGAGCVVVGGYSSDGGFWIWPGTFVLLAIALVVFLLLRRRR